jgi:hypothetical protein
MRRLGTLGVRHAHRGLPFLADREDAVPPDGALWEGHSPLCPVLLRTAGTPSLPTWRSSQGHPAIGCGCRFRRGARVLPFLADRGGTVPPTDPVGGVQSSAPGIFPDREDAVPPWDLVGEAPCPVPASAAAGFARGVVAEENRRGEGRPGRLEQPGVVIFKCPGPVHLSGRGFGKRGFRG